MGWLLEPPPKSCDICGSLEAPPKNLGNGNKFEGNMWFQHSSEIRISGFLKQKSKSNRSWSKPLCKQVLVACPKPTGPPEIHYFGALSLNKKLNWSFDCYIWRNHPHLQNWISNISKQFLLLSCILISPHFLHQLERSKEDLAWATLKADSPSPPSRMAGAQKKAPNGATDRERKAEKKAPDTWRPKMEMEMEPGRGVSSFPMGFFSSVNEGNKKGNESTEKRHQSLVFFVFGWGGWEVWRGFREWRIECGVVINEQIWWRNDFCWVNKCFVLGLVLVTLQTTKS